MFGGTSENEQICPGEGNCEIFQTAAGRSRTAKEQNACIGRNCPMFATKVNPNFEKEEDYLSGIVRSAANFRCRRNSGESLADLMFEMKPIEYECLVRLDAKIEQKELELKIETKDLLLAFLKSRAF
jgi:hypothetical protein